MGAHRLQATSTCLSPHFNCKAIHGCTFLFFFFSHFKVIFVTFVFQILQGTILSLLHRGQDFFNLF